MNLKRSPTVPIAAGPLRSDTQKGLVAAVIAFLIWGLLPLYIKQISSVPPVQIMAHRLVWCCVFALLWLGATGNLAAVGRALKNPGVLGRLSISAALICLNWLLFIWAINNNHVVDSSLGYFINPLVNVLLGVTLLSERLNTWQWLAILCAALGVAYLGWVGGHVPWIALVLAFSFSGYGLIRKTVAVDALTGLAAETLLAAPLGAAYLIWEFAKPQAELASAPPLVVVLLVLSGVITAVPLALFSYAARRLPYSTVGLVQYLGPSVQFFLGIYVYHEHFSIDRAFGFGLIWAALAIYIADGFIRARRLQGAAGQA